MCRMITSEISAEHHEWLRKIPEKSIQNESQTENGQNL